MKTAGKEIKAEVVSLQYEGRAVVKALRNSKKYEWSLTKNGPIAELQQKLTVGFGRTTQTVSANYDSTRNRTTIQDSRVRRRGDDD